MIKGVGSVFTRIIFRVIFSRLQRLEVKLVKCVCEIGADGNHPFSTSQLKLAMKALASYRGMLLLRQARLYQEAHSAQRTFLECWVYLMDFSWNPNVAVFEWWKHPSRPLSEKKLQLRQRVQADFAKRLNLNSRQKPSLIRMFDDLSNSSVHPTKDAVEGAWGCALDRCRLSRSKQMTNLRLFEHAVDSFSYVMLLAWFMRFLRTYVLSFEPINHHFKKRTLLESWLERWSVSAPDHVQAIFDQAQMQYARQKRQEREAAACNARSRINNQGTRYFEIRDSENNVIEIFEEP